MNKIGLEALVAERTNMNRQFANDAVKAAFDIIGEALARGDTVRISGFATFTSKFKPERQGKNPKTGEPITIKASRKIVVRPGKNLVDQVNASL